MARLFLLGDKSSQIINLDYVSLIEIAPSCEFKEGDIREKECDIREKECEYRIRFYLTKEANLDTTVIFHDYIFATEQDARNFLVAALNLEF